MLIMDSLILHGVRFAAEAHHGVTRKWSTTPYIVHPMRVMNRMMLHPLGDDVNILLACVCHDILEDCPQVGWSALIGAIGLEAAHMVEELTNPSKQHPELNRAQKKTMDREHLKTVSLAARCIKLIDRADNVRDMGRDAAYWERDRYFAESELLLTALTGSDQDLEAELATALHLER